MFEQVRVKKHFNKSYFINFLKIHRSSIYSSHIVLVGLIFKIRMGLNSRPRFITIILQRNQTYRHFLMSFKKKTNYFFFIFVVCCMCCGCYLTLTKNIKNLIKNFNLEFKFWFDAMNLKFLLLFVEWILSSTSSFNYFFWDKFNFLTAKNSYTTLILSI